MNYTKGDWEVYESPSAPTVVIRDGLNLPNRIIAICRLERGSEDMGKALANAHLIATAPKMYELLKILAYEIRQSDNPQALWEGLLHTVAAKIDPILAKAEG